ncbi:MAG: DUF5039 family protein [Bacteroides sp.]|nr:DUF5039 family protein [Bacteroides sp.]
MKNIRWIFLLVCCILINSSVSFAQAQTADELGKSLQQIGTDLQEKTIKLSWGLTEEYLKYCEASNRNVEISSEEYLGSLVNLEKPKELSSYREAYEKSKAAVENYLMAFPEYIQIDSLRRNIRSEEDRKNANVAMSSFRNWLWNKDDKFKQISNTNSFARRKYYLEAVRYMFKEYKEAGRIMPTSFINFDDRQYLLSNNAELRLLSDEVDQLERLQKRVLSQYQKLKYNITDTEEQVRFR